MKTIITTVGTSMFTNYQEKKKDLDDKIEDLKLKPYSEWDDWKDDIQVIEKAIIEQLYSDASAEIKSTLKLKEKYNQIAVHLIATDTILSVLAAKILRRYFEEKNIDCTFSEKEDIIQDLQVNNAKNFEKNGIVNLVDRLDKIIKNSYYENVIFNITGGYKAIIPYITIMAQINNIPLYYIFEDTDNLIKIPQAPLDINLGIFEKYGNVLIDLSKGITENWEDYKRRNNIGEDFSACIWEEDNMAELNAIGKMFWEKYRTSFRVKIIRGSGYVSDKEGNRNEIEKAFTELYERILNVIQGQNIKDTSGLIDFIVKLGDQNDLRHGTNPDKDKFIFKSTKTNQIRIAYSPEFKNGDIILWVYDYVRGTFDHSCYIKEFEVKIKNITKKDFISIPIRKP